MLPSDTLFPAFTRQHANYTDAGSEYVGHFKAGLRHGAGKFTFAHKTFEYDWARHAAAHGEPKRLAQDANAVADEATDDADTDAANGGGGVSGAGATASKGRSSRGAAAAATSAPGSTLGLGSAWGAHSPRRSAPTGSVDGNAPLGLRPGNSLPPATPPRRAQRALAVVADLTGGSSNGKGAGSVGGGGSGAATGGSSQARLRWKGGASKLKLVNALGKAPAALQLGTPVTLARCACQWTNEHRCGQSSVCKSAQKGRQLL